jgi:hypothetical protein
MERGELLVVVSTVRAEGLVADCSVEEEIREGRGRLACWLDREREEHRWRQLELLLASVENK